MEKTRGEISSEDRRSMKFYDSIDLKKNCW